MKNKTMIGIVLGVIMITSLIAMAEALSYTSATTETSTSVKETSTPVSAKVSKTATLNEVTQAKAAPVSSAQTKTVEVSSVSEIKLKPASATSLKREISTKTAIEPIIGPYGIIGDVNGDGIINFDDIDALNFVLENPKLVNQNIPAMYHRADLDNDGKLNNEDVNKFVALLSQQNNNERITGKNNYGILGDVNGDRRVNFEDIGAFLFVLWHPTLINQYVPAMYHRADVSGDGSVNLGDINPFVKLISKQ